MAELPIILLSHNIRSLWNVGSLFRSADAFGVERLILTGYTPRPPRPEIAKTALGAEEWVLWSHAADPIAAINDLRKGGYAIAALERAAGSTPLGEFRRAAPTCLVVGHEIAGVPREVLAACDVVLEIPMRGKKESLNVAVAAGIALHQLRIGETFDCTTKFEIRSTKSE